MATGNEALKRRMDASRRLPEKKGRNIAELESLAVTTATNTWRKKIQGNDVLVYLDNIVSAYSFIKAGPKNPVVAEWARGGAGPLGAYARHGVPVQLSPNRP